MTDQAKPDNQAEAYIPPKAMTFKRSDIANMSHTEYQKHRKSILQAARSGNIEDDMRGPLGAAPVTVFSNGKDQPLDVEDMPHTLGIV